MRHRVPCLHPFTPIGYTRPDPTPRAFGYPVSEFRGGSISIILFASGRAANPVSCIQYTGRWTLYTGTVSSKLVCVRLGRRGPRTPVSERTLFKLLVTLAPCSVNCHLSALRSIHRSMPAFQRACSIVTEPARSGYRENRVPAVQPTRFSHSYAPRSSYGTDVPGRVCVGVAAGRKLKGPCVLVFSCSCVRNCGMRRVADDGQPGGDAATPCPRAATAGSRYVTRTPPFAVRSSS